MALKSYCHNNYDACDVWLHACMQTRVLLGQDLVAIFYNHVKPISDRVATIIAIISLYILCS